MSCWLFSTYIKCYEQQAVLAASSAYISTPSSSWQTLEPTQYDIVLSMQPFDEGRTTRRPNDTTLTPRKKLTMKNKPPLLGGAEKFWTNLQQRNVHVFRDCILIGAI